MSTSGRNETVPAPDGEARRRDVLNWLVGGWLAGVLGSILYPVARYLVPPDVPEATPPSVVRAHERAALTNAWSGAQIETLAPAGAANALEPLMITLEPGGQSASPPFARDGESFAFVCEGDVLLTLGDAIHRLSRGDAATFSSETPHRWENSGQDLARMVVVSAPNR